jgi:hypothetical protein
MLLPNHIFDLIQALHEKHPDLARGDDEARRTLQKKIVETAVARHPREGWGWKKASDTRPPSKDAIANNRLMPGHLLAWDCFDGATRAPVQREAMNIDGQLFIELAGVDHLRTPGTGASTTSGTTTGLQTVTPPPPPALPSRTEFLATLLWLDTLYREQLGRPDGVDFEGIAAHVFDTYLKERLRGVPAPDAKRLVVRHINQILGRTDIHV